jgi:hypothetical protein|eukprot:SAG25_NODE_5118_length_700_cov_1.094842_2_plen_75_part_00
MDHHGLGWSGRGGQVRGHSAGQLYSDGGRQRGRVGPGQEQEILMVKQSVIGGIIGETGRPSPLTDDPCMFPRRF